ncbi:MAG: OmpA family protein, partial [Planctomycetota bacterium]
MRRGFAAVRGTGVVAVMVALVWTGALAGCARQNLTRNRNSVLEAENVNARQRASMAEQSARQAQLDQDRAVADLQRAQHQLTQAQRETVDLSAQAAVGREAQEALAQSLDDRERQAKHVAELRKQVDRLTILVARRRQAVVRATVKPTAKLDYQGSADAEAFRRDLESKLAAANINLPVETRISRSGEQRVAVVLRGAFPPGKASPAYNMDAVRVIVGLGDLITSEYPQSHVRIEGHTDRDPIRKSPWPSNQALSLARAASVKKLLVKAGVPGGSVETVGRGPSVPLETGTSKRAKATNR